MIGKEDGKIPEAITRYIVALYWQSPLLHFESSAFAFFQMRGQKSVRTSQKPAKRNLSLSISFSFAYSLALLPELLRLLLFQFPLPLLLLLLLLLVLLVLLWVFRTVSGPHKLILLPNLKSNAFTHGSLLSLLDLLLLLVLPPHPLLLHHHYH